jgi:hypothetical protein
MDTLKVIEDDERKIVFQLLLPKNIELKSIAKKSIPNWTFEFWINIPLYGHYRFEYENGRFIPANSFKDFVEANLPKKTLKEINEGFKELIIQLKKHPTYRLKLLHVLNKEMREIWNKV